MKIYCVILALLFIHLAIVTATSSNPVVHPVPKTRTRPRTVNPHPNLHPVSPKGRIHKPADFLSSSYYSKSCPSLEAIIHQKVRAWVKRDFTMAASIIRLHFHDCVVRGCDASILLNHRGSERRAHASKSLRGFTLVDEIKAEVEKRCPKTVSCADILTAAARDATVLAGGPFWEVPFGRKDGRISLAKEADTLVPQGHENITGLIDTFEKIGLNIIDLVVLSGAHTIGRSSCSTIKSRLSGKFNVSRAGVEAPIDLKYVHYLRKLCKSDRNLVNLDVTTPRTFDNAYYTNLAKKMGLLSTDQLLFSDLRTEPIVAALASQPQLFFSQFLVSMVKLGNVHVLAGKNQGEVRSNCNYVNS